MRAVYARNRPPGSHVAHLTLEDTGRAMCGALAGDPAPAVTCRGCASRWAYQTRQGRAAMHAAREDAMFTTLAEAMARHRGAPTREQAAAALLAANPLPPPDPDAWLTAALAAWRSGGAPDPEQ